MAVRDIAFSKMNGCGNDFIIIDNRKQVISEGLAGEFARKVCARKVSLGADGLLLLENSAKLDFKMRLFNPDGSEGEMCGNGARCIARFAYMQGISGKELAFETKAGRIEGSILAEDKVEIKIREVLLFREISELRQIFVIDRFYDYYSLFLGVPHCVIFVKQDFPLYQLHELSRQIRFNQDHFPSGTNVNFVTVENNRTLFVKTYERGVEEITLACGTGATSSAVVAALTKKAVPPVVVNTLGGILEVTFVEDNEAFKDIKLVGDAKLVVRGELTPDAFSW